MQEKVLNKYEKFMFFHDFVKILTYGLKRLLKIC